MVTVRGTTIACHKDHRRLSDGNAVHYHHGMPTKWQHVTRFCGNAHLLPARHIGPM